MFYFDKDFCNTGNDYQVKWAAALRLNYVMTISFLCIAIAKLFCCIYSMYRGSRPEMFFRKGVSEIFTKIYRKTSYSLQLC